MSALSVETRSVWHRAPADGVHVDVWRTTTPETVIYAVGLGGDGLDRLEPHYAAMVADTIRQAARFALREQELARTGKRGRSA
jgi:hypothetical protein